MARKRIIQMKNDKILLQVRIVNFYLRCLMQRGSSTDQALEEWKKLNADMNGTLKADGETYHWFLHSYVLDGNFMKALSAFKYLKSKNPEIPALQKTYYYLINGLMETYNNVDEAAQLLTLMKKDGWVPSASAFYALFDDSRAKQWSDYLRAQRILDELELHIDPNKQVSIKMRREMQPWETTDRTPKLLMSEKQYKHGQHQKYMIRKSLLKLRHSERKALLPKREKPNEGKEIEGKEIKGEEDSDEEDNDEEDNDQEDVDRQETQIKEENDKEPKN